MKREKLNLGKFVTFGSNSEKLDMNSARLTVYVERLFVCHMKPNEIAAGSGKHQNNYIKSAASFRLGAALNTEWVQQQRDFRYSRIKMIA